MKGFLALLAILFCFGCTAGVSPEGFAPSGPLPACAACSQSGKPTTQCADRLAGVSFGIKAGKDVILFLQFENRVAIQMTRIPVLGGSLCLRKEDIDFDGHLDLLIQQTLNAHGDVQPQVFIYNPTRHSLELNWDYCLPNLTAFPQKKLLRGAVGSDANGFLEVQVCYLDQIPVKKGKLTCLREPGFAARGNWDCKLCRWTSASDSTCLGFGADAMQADSLYAAWQ